MRRVDRHQGIGGIAEWLGPGHAAHDRIQRHVNQASGTEPGNETADPVGPMPKDQAQDQKAQPQDWPMRQVFVMMVTAIVDEVEPQHVDIRCHRSDHRRGKYCGAEFWCCGAKEQVSPGQVTDKHQVCPVSCASLCCATSSFLLARCWSAMQRSTKLR